MHQYLIQCISVTPDKKVCCKVSIFLMCYRSCHYFELFSLSTDTPGRPECFPIPIPSDDPHFTHSCMEFVRSASDPCQAGMQKKSILFRNYTSYFMNIHCLFIFISYLLNKKKLRSYLIELKPKLNTFDT